MVPCSFDEENGLLSKPDEMTTDECTPLNVYMGVDNAGYNVVISCWKITKEELDIFQKTGRIWLTVYGAGMPPVSLDANSPFQETVSDGAQ